MNVLKRGRHKGPTVAPALDPHCDAIAAWFMNDQKTYVEILALLESTWGIKISYASLFAWWKNRQSKMYAIGSARTEDLIKEVQKDLAQTPQSRVTEVVQDLIERYNSDPEGRYAVRRAEQILRYHSIEIDRELREKQLKQRKNEQAAKRRSEMRIHSFNERKFQFSAAEAVLQYCEKNGISLVDNTLKLNERVEAVRVKIFGAAA